MRALALKAGPTAHQIVRERGLRLADVDVLPAASGGAKWLAIAGLDTYLFGQVFRPTAEPPRTRPLYAIGSSIGSWRMACLTQRDPVAALERGHAAYVYQQQYSARPTTTEVTRVLSGCLDAMLGDHGVADVMTHPFIRSHIITAAATGLAASTSRAALSLALALAAAGNAIHRGTLGWQFRRTIFHNADDASPLLHLRDYPTAYEALTTDNVRLVLLASGSIPLLVEGVRMSHDPHTTHWDGGVIDYHPDMPLGPIDGMVLYPHFYSHVVPGWFDKALPWRRAGAQNFARTLLIAPSAEFVATLPGGRIPNRRDFQRLSHRERERCWQTTIDMSAQLGEELHELMATGTLAAHVKPWT